MKLEPITINTIVAAPLSKTWDCYTMPDHITKWNFASSDWHCPNARNDMRVGGTYLARMEAKDGSFGFDFEAVYTNVVHHNTFSYEFGGRIATVQFKENGSITEVTIIFDPETQNSPEMQKAGWQSILDNFKKYTESL